MTVVARAEQYWYNKYEQMKGSDGSKVWKDRYCMTGLDTYAMQLKRT